MIIVLNASGQFGNRVLLAAHAVAMGMKYNQRVFLPFVNDLRHTLSFDDSIEKKYRIKRMGKNNVKLFRKPLMIMEIASQKRKNKYYSNKKIHRKGIHFICNWYCRDYDALMEYRNEIVNLFSWQKDISEDTKIYIENLKHTYDPSVYNVIGVHIRRGDYINWRNGQYYFDDDTYIKHMRELSNSSTKKVVFLLFSNEPLDSETYDKSGLEYVFVKDVKKRFGFDMSVMSECDYIMGPPSTFSWWAAFVGDKPYLTLKSKDSNADIACFDYVKGEEFNPNKTLDELKENGWA